MIERTRSAGPFTAAKLRIVLDGVLTRAYKKPGRPELEWLAASLNRIHGLFTFAVTTANKSKPAADSVHAALETLTLFFEARKLACFPEGGQNPSREVVASETRLYDQFHAFLQVMAAHDFQLDMDAGLLMPHIENWRALAGLIAGCFKAAMTRTNPGQAFGRSNDGPVPRFVAAVVPHITGEKPTVLNVGKWLKDQGREGRQRPGTKRM